MADRYVEQTQPFIVPTTDGKRIAEHFGRASTGETALSIAHMIAPPFWSEPEQRPEFDEYTIVLRGRKRILVDGREVVLEAGQSILVRRYVPVQYSNPFASELESLSICLPAFAPELAHRQTGDATRAQGADTDGE